MNARLIAPNCFQQWHVVLGGLVCFLVPIVLLTPAAAAEPQVAVDRLRCEYREDPLGIDTAKPRLSWALKSEARGVKQTAYQIEVASSPEKLAAGEADLWDSGRVESDETVNIPYAGRTLQSRDQCYWQVRIWGAAGEPLQSQSKAASWTMGLLNDSDWQAEYITYLDKTPVSKDTKSLQLPPAQQYRKGFTAKKKIKRATIYATALGIYELHLNGTRVGDQFFAPGWTDYRQRAYYQTYDVTDQIKVGENALGACVADGWYSGYAGFGLLTGIGTEMTGRHTYGKTPSVMLQLEIEYEDGSRTTVATDESWKVTTDGPVREADLLMGEAYDARKEMPGWSKAGFDESHWDTVLLASETDSVIAKFYEFDNPASPGAGPKKVSSEIDLGFQRPELEAFPGMPVRAIEEIKPIEISTDPAGNTIFNLGQNMAGVVRLRVKGPAGHRVVLRYGEMLHPDGRLMTENLRKARATDYYTLKGDPEGETFVPRFTFHGFQYVEVSNLPSEPTKDTITGIVLHSDTPLTSEFECSDPMANRLFKNVVWTQRANFIDLPTDCPQRDERMGWTGDAQVYIGTATYNADVAAFFTKWMRELMESQRESGTFPGYAPYPFQHGWDFGTAWADAGIICPWTIWQAYGDTRIIETCWEPMTRFMQWRQRTSRNSLGVVHGNNWGDWLTQGKATPLDYIDTVYFAISTKKMAQMADAIDRSDEASQYEKQFDVIKNAFNKKYVRERGKLTVDTQTAYALALFANLVPDEDRDAFGQTLADKIHANGNRMTTGFLGTRPLLPVLSDAGQHDLAAFLFQSRVFPSWGYEVDQGATTIWERWDSYTKEDAFGRHNASMNSFSHYAFGAVCEWMFRTLAGIESDGPAYKKITIHPHPPTPGSNAEREAIEWVNAAYDSLRGRIESRWEVEGTGFELEVTIPANTTAQVFVPADDIQNVKESGKSIADANSVEFLRMENGTAVLQIGSGSYRFESPNAMKPASNAYETSVPADR